MFETVGEVGFHGSDAAAAHFVGFAEGFGEGFFRHEFYFVNFLDGFVLVVLFGILFVVLVAAET